MAANHRTIQRETLHGYLTHNALVREDGRTEFTYRGRIAAMPGVSFNQLAREQSQQRLADGYAEPRMIEIPFEQLTFGQP
nr:hypothetical protein OHB51_12930 [Micromonospora sp. NBC_00855]